MSAINIHEAKTHLSRLIEQVRAGTPVVISKAGTPLVKITAIDAPALKQRIGFLAGAIAVPDDFDRMGSDNIAAMFDGAA